MGKPSIDRAPYSDDAVSLHTQPGDSYLDHDAPELQDDDLPPLYEDVADSSSSSAPLLASTPTNVLPPSAISCTYKDANTGLECFLDPQLDADPKYLESHLRYWASIPPRPYVRVFGSHRERVDNNGKKENKSVTDFDVKVELTPYLFSDASNRISWRGLSTVENGEKTRRGTVLRKRAPGHKQAIEVGHTDKPTLAEWCHLYCASHAGLKVFSLKRKVTGFDAEKLKERLESMVRQTNYRGSLQVTFPVVNDQVDVYNDCKTNRWRMTNWIAWLCYLTLMFIFTWPYLFFRTKRFEVAVAEWPFSRPGQNGTKEYVSISEDQWYNMWARAVSKAVLEKRQATLDQQDLISSQSMDQPFNTGSSTVDGALGFLRAAVSATNEVNRQLGWGGHTC
ncbi:putative abc transporter protein [Phaeoacremonium minimum UCRPA7]|uniref:Putative abc transporter protein n=1 Tax=Phaeoacremonium minimum (strain UCR-PA7) TaxID=1286976 RepID=R8BCS0_PHAM7|nr:putative abc transporter protein [Phaeoacremonium minimum UCRPA7]EON97091.1 putative abc transporter protein [Phaeoacremonium minimum UCRPA7]